MKQTYYVNLLNLATEEKYGVQEGGLLDCMWSVDIHTTVEPHKCPKLDFVYLELTKEVKQEVQQLIGEPMQNCPIQISIRYAGQQATGIVCRKDIIIF